MLERKLEQAAEAKTYRNGTHQGKLLPTAFNCKTFHVRAPRTSFGDHAQPPPTSGRPASHHVGSGAEKKGPALQTAGVLCILVVTQTRRNRATSLGQSRPRARAALFFFAKRVRRLRSLSSCWARSCGKAMLRGEAGCSPSARLDREGF